MREAESVGVKALGMHQQHQQRHQQGGAYPKKAKSVSNGFHGHYQHHHQNNNYNNGYYHNQSAKQLVYHNSQFMLSQSAPQGGQEYGVNWKGNNKNGKGTFHRTSSLNDAPIANNYYGNNQHRNNYQKPPRFRTTSGDVQMNSAGCSSANTSNRSSPTSLPRSPIHFASPKPAKAPTTKGHVTPVNLAVDSETYFAMSKFTESPEPSALPPPPAHWLTPKKKELPVVATSPCKAEFQKPGALFDGIDVTAHFKTLLRVEM